jgi:hypothetical protein
VSLRICARPTRVSKRAVGGVGAREIERLGAKPG